MRTEDFHDWLSKASALPLATPATDGSLEPEAGSGRGVMGAIVGPPPPCPHGHHPPCSHWGNAHGLPRYRCGACGKVTEACRAQRASGVVRRSNAGCRRNRFRY